MFIVKRIYSFLDIQRFSAQENNNKLYKAKAADDKHASLDRFLQFKLELLQRTILTEIS